MAGNEEEIKEVTFTIGDGGGDGTAPVTTHTLDPDEGPYTGPVGVTLSATDPDEPGGGGEAETHEVNALPSTWDPNALQIATGDVVQWNFPEATAGAPHNVYLIGPGEAPDSAGTLVSEQVVVPGSPPVSETLDEAGTWTYVCKIHSHVEDGHWTGMVGTAEATGAAQPGSGVEITEYRVDTGPWVRHENTEGDDPFERSFVVADAGPHVVQYRSIDGAGNVEVLRSVEFSIGNGAPSLQVTADRLSGTAPLVVRFTATATDPNGDRPRVAWDFGDGQRAVGEDVPHAYLQPGNYTATATATDASGLQTSRSVQITVTGTSGSPPQGDDESPASIDAPRRMTAQQLIRRGLRLKVSCEEACRAKSVLRISGERVGASKQRRIRAGGSRTLVARLEADVRRNLLKAMRQAGLRRVTLTAVTTVRCGRHDARAPGEGDAAALRLVRVGRARQATGAIGPQPSRSCRSSWPRSDDQRPLATRCSTRVSTSSIAVRASSKPAAKISVSAASRMRSCSMGWSFAGPRSSRVFTTRP